MKCDICGKSKSYSFKIPLCYPYTFPDTKISLHSMKNIYLCSKCMSTKLKELIYLVYNNKDNNMLNNMIKIFND